MQRFRCDLRQGPEPILPLPYTRPPVGNFFALGTGRDEKAGTAARLNRHSEIRILYVFDTGATRSYSWPATRPGGTPWYRYRAWPRPCATFAASVAAMPRPSSQPAPASRSAPSRCIVIELHRSARPPGGTSRTRPARLRRHHRAPPSSADSVARMHWLFGALGPRTQTIMF